MLNEDEKQRIREEEIFRQEVRQQLDAEKSSPSMREKAWRLINSAFALWLLSTVVIGLLGWAYQSRQANKTEQAQRKEVRRTLVAELVNRSTYALTASFENSTKIDQGDPDSPKFVVSRILGILDGSDIVSKSNISSVYPEYQSRSYLSLVTELEGILTEDGKKILSDEDDYVNLRIYLINAPEFQANDDVDKKIAKAREAGGKISTFTNRLFSNLVRLNSKVISDEKA